MNNSNTKIKARNFDEQKEKLKKFAQTLPKTVNIKKVAGGRVVFLKRKATGDDVKKITEQIGEALIDQNNNTIEIYREFRSIYNTFDALDKDYIQRILVNLEATKKANEKAVLGLEKNKELVGSQEKIINVLKKHKEELDGLKYLKNIDTFYENYECFVAEQIKKSENFSSNQQKMEDKIKEIYEKHDIFSKKYENKVIEMETKHQSIDADMNSLQDNQTIILDKIEQNRKEMLDSQEQLLRKNEVLKKATIASFSIVFILLILIITGVLS